MNLFDFHKTILSTSADYLKKLSAFNPLTIRKKGTRAKALFALALVCILWGTTWIASKEGVRRMPALQLAGIRQLIAGILYVGFFLYKKWALPKGKEWIPVIGVDHGSHLSLMAGSDRTFYFQRKTSTKSITGPFAWVQRCVHHLL
jgi:hypothetical protein